jgi:hypothetical protein
MAALLTDSGWIICFCINCFQINRFLIYYLSWGGVGETFGVGGEFRIAKGVRLRVGYDYTSADIENLDYDYYYDNFEVSLSQVSVGVHYQF